MKLKYLVLLASIVFVTFAYAARITVVGDIEKIQVNGETFIPYSASGNAIAFIYMDELPAPCDGNAALKRVAITSNHPAYDTVISLALAAYATKTQVSLSYLDSCTL